MSSLATSPPKATEPRNVARFARIPLALTEEKRWCLWRYEIRGDKPTKVPYGRNGRAKSNDPCTWMSYSEALAAYQSGNYDGIGFMLGDGWAGVDLDHVIDANGTIEPWAQKIVDNIHTLTEISPSKTGVKMIMRGTLPPGRRRKGQVEMYCAGRFFTITGDQFPGTPLVIEDRTPQLAALHAEIFAEEKLKPVVKPIITAPDDQKIIDKVTADPKWGKLWSGDISAYGSHSEADLAMAGRIAFFAGADPARIASIFSQSALTRDKWDRADYRDATIAKALSSMRDFYRWNGKVAAKKSEPATVIASIESEGLEARSQLLTDVGNSARFVKHHGPNIRFCHPWGKFIIWNARNWQIDERGTVYKWAMQTVLGIYREAADEQDEGRRDALIQHAKASQRKERINAMIELAKPYISIVPADLDSDPFLLNAQNGTINLKTGELNPHRREDYITKICRASYDPSAKCPIFLRFLERIFRSLISLVPFLQKVLGYGCTGTTIEQALFFLYGTGSNGKTTLMDAVMYVLGDYAAKADRDLLTASDGAQHPTNVADLMGRRMALVSETSDGKRFDESKLKDLAGETRLKARWMRCDFFEFVATHKIFMYGNHKPVVRGTDYGFWRRMRLIPFVEVIGDDEKDRGLLDKLKAEADGVLTWLVKGCMAWQRDGLGLPDEVAKATDGYRAEMDSIGAFLAECCLFGERMEATAKDLYASYSSWCEDSGEHPLSQKRLGMQLTERSLISDRDTYSGRKIWRGIGLKVTPQRDNRHESFGSDN